MVISGVPVGDASPDSYASCSPDKDMGNPGGKLGACRALEDASTAA